MRNEDSGQGRQTTVVPANQVTLLGLAKSPDATIGLSKEQQELAGQADERAGCSHRDKR